MVSCMSLPWWGYTAGGLLVFVIGIITIIINSTVIGSGNGGRGLVTSMTLNGGFGLLSCFAGVAIGLGSISIGSMVRVNQYR